ncbi:MAG: hypothetical protein OXQ29_07845 [Rhodospirillaceae bacterium]|nr:hypothetical protein [Rhodospirillaceae bacterium]
MQGPVVRKMGADRGKAGSGGEAVGPVHEPPADLEESAAEPRGGQRGG